MAGKKGVRVIGYAPERMREMLESVCFYNSGFNPDENLLEKVLFAIIVIDRKFFYGNENTYDDTALPIGKGQTISQPSTVARMLLLANLQKGDDVLEVGAGSGWNSALISFLVYPGSVTSIDRIGGLLEKARENTKKLRNHLKQTMPQDAEKISRLNFIAEDIFFKGKAWKRKYDKIIITAGISDEAGEEKIGDMAQSLIKKNGILICPHVSGPLIIYKKNRKLEKEETKEQYVFVPLLEGLEK